VQSSAELRRLAAFLAHAADEMDVEGAAFEHLHFESWADDWQPGDADLIVLPPGAR
jgi:hypothetical protein